MNTGELFCKLQTAKPVGIPPAIAETIHAEAKQCIALTAGVSDASVFLSRACDYMEVRHSLFGHLLFDPKLLNVPWTSEECAQLLAAASLLQRKLDLARTTNSAYSKFQTAIYRKGGLRG